MPDFSLQRSFSIASRLDRQIDAAGEAYRGQIDRAIRAVGVSVSREITDRTADTGRLLRAPAFTTRAIASAISRHVRPVVARGIASLASVADLANDIAGKTGAARTEDRALLAAIARTLERDLTGRLDTLLSDVFSALQQGQASRQLADELESEIDDLLTRYVTWSRTAYETALSTFAQGVVATTAKATDAYLYVGPIDARIRPFCEKTVARVWSRARIDRMDNGITPNTFLRRGGPNCRHLWVPAPASLAPFINTGRVVDERYRLELAAASTGLGGGVRRTA